MYSCILQPSLETPELLHNLCTYDIDIANLAFCLVSLHPTDPDLFPHYLMFIFTLFISLIYFHSTCILAVFVCFYQIRHISHFLLLKNQLPIITVTFLSHSFMTEHHAPLHSYTATNFRFIYLKLD